MPKLLHGMWISLQIAFIAGAIGISLGTLLGIAEGSKHRGIRTLVTLYVTIWRGTPMLVQILFVFYVLPQFGIRIAPFWAACVAIGLNSSAYISQIVCAGIRAVPQGQIEAAYTLGLNKFATLRYIIMPQALRITMPAFGNELITLIKDSSLASIIGVMELSKEGSVIRSHTYDAFSILLAVSMIYLLMTSTVSLIINKIDKALKTYA